MKAEQQILLSPSQFEGLKLAISLSLDLLRNEFATDPHERCAKLTELSEIRQASEGKVNLIAQNKKILEAWASSLLIHRRAVKARCERSTNPTSRAKADTPNGGKSSASISASPNFPQLPLAHFHRRRRSGAPAPSSERVK